MEIKISCCKDCPFLGYEYDYDSSYSKCCNHPKSFIKFFDLKNFNEFEIPEWCAFRASKTLTLTLEEK